MVGRLLDESYTIYRLEGWLEDWRVGGFEGLRVAGWTI